MSLIGKVALHRAVAYLGSENAEATIVMNSPDNCGSFSLGKNMVTRTPSSLELIWSALLIDTPQYHWSIIC